MTVGRIFAKRSQHIVYSSNHVPHAPVAMVDIHCHILPNVDDGSRSWEMTAEMCRVAADDGVRHIVATPHCNHKFAYDRSRYEAMLLELREASLGRLEFSIGCDFHFSYENITDALDNPTRYTI